MKFARIGSRGQENPVVLMGNRAFDLSSITQDIGEKFFESGGIAAVEAALADGVLAEIDISGQRIGPPISRPSAVI